MTNELDQLFELARLWGIEPSYDDIFGNHVTSPPEAIFAALRALGAPISAWSDIEGAIRDRRSQLGARVLPPVVVAWGESAVTVPVQLPTDSPAGSWVCSLTFDATASRNPARWLLTDGQAIQLPGNLPPGYHTLRLEGDGQEWKSTVIAAPNRAHSPTTDDRVPQHGVFIPLYALWSNRSWGAGDFGDLGRLQRLSGSAGCRFVGTLPLLACDIRPGETPSPYSPVSRLFWNEFYLDIDAIPDLRTCESAGAVITSDEFRRGLASVRSARQCEYASIMNLKRRILEILAHEFFGGPTARRREFEQYLAHHPRLRDYAAFRATAERHGSDWRNWPSAASNGTLSSGDFDPVVQRYHMYVQWLAHEQMAVLSRNRAGLYLDLPLGVNPDGYDIWRERNLFVQGMAVGAPPDNLFLGGQNWGFPPLNPEVSRDHGHHYLKSVLRHHMHHARMLRIDHVMGLHRLFWVPQGMAATEGVYIRQPHEELYAILSLESERHRTVIVGEDLGTVPDFVRESMDRHALHRMYVAQFDLRADSNHAIGPVVSGSVASLNTHDTPTFAGFCAGRDIDDLLDLKLVKPTDEPALRVHRDAQLTSVENYLRAKGYPIVAADRNALVRALIEFMSDSQAMAVLINLEDLWLESAPHNVPGTVEERPNWRRKSQRSLDQMEQSGVLDGLFQSVNVTVKGN